jgi:hypothetical protein
VRVGLATFVVSTALAVSIQASVGAVTSTDLHAQASAISAKINAADAQLHSLAERYLTEHQNLDQAKAAVDALNTRIAALRHAIRADKANLRIDAVTTYVQAGSDEDLSLVFADSSPSMLGLGDAYLRVATGRLSQDSVLLDNSLHNLEGTLSAEQQAAAAAADAQSRTSAYRETVLSSVAEEQALYNSVHGELAVLVAREQAASEAAAAARASVGPPKVIGLKLTTDAPSLLPSSLSGAFAGIRNCESGDRYYLNTGNGYYGAYQFSYSTWRGLGGAGLASEASPAEQDAAAYRLYQSSGWRAWPECAAILGLG